MRKASEFMSEYFVSEIWPHYEKYALAVEKKKPRTVELYWGHICNLCDDCHMDFLDIGELEADKYLTKLYELRERNKITSYTIKNKLIAFKILGNYIQNNYMEETSYYNPYSAIKVPLTDDSINANNVPSIAELDQIMSAAKKYPVYFVILTLASRVGLTAKEIIGLTKDHLQNHDGILVLVRRTSDSETNSYIPLPEDVSSILMDYIDNLTFSDQEGHLFYNKYNNAITIKNIDVNIRKIVKDSSVPRLYSLKDFRTRAILDMLHAGATVEQVNDYTGLKPLRLHNYNSSKELISDCPAALVNYQLKTTKTDKEG